jgi:hypothetical protein
MSFCQDNEVTLTISECISKKAHSSSSRPDILREDCNLQYHVKLIYDKFSTSFTFGLRL